MGLFGSLAGASLGWFTLGPVGAIIGLIVGHVAEESSSRSSQQNINTTARDGFIASLLVLMAAVMKADGKVVRSELSFVKAYLVRTFGEQKASEALLMLREILNKEIPVRDVCTQIKANVDYSSRLELLHLLFEVAKSDGSIPQAELNVLQEIAKYLGLSATDYTSILNMYIESTESAYKILEISAEATDDEVKKAYRKMALKYHPDKVSHLGEEFQKTAGEKFRKVNEAYEKIKKSRGLV
ncbi:MAG: TerB family tellurite resistance protein [Breznakibacter sp.]|nr:TerB family tellurite resistance protein [Breznakibacter sp.]